MPRHTTFLPPSPIQVVPMEGENVPENTKQIVIQCGDDVFFYPMGEELAKEISRDLKMSNASLIDKLEQKAKAAREEYERAVARDKLGIGPEVPATARNGSGLITPD